MTALVIGVTLVTAVALIVLTSLLHSSTASLANALESVRVAEELEITLLLHSRATDPLLREALADALDDRILDARRHVLTADEAAALDAVDRRFDAYLASHAPEHALTELRESAFRAAQDLVDVNLLQARAAQTAARRWDWLGNVFGATAAALMLVVAGVLLWWLRTRAFRPLWAIVRAMRAFARGDRAARAEVSGFAELRDVALGFNQMASALAAQRQAQMTFLGGVAHDLRNPLMALRMAVSALDRGGPLPAERTRKMLELVARQTTHLERMVGDLLDIARIEAGELELRLEPRDLRELARDSLALFVDQSPRHTLALALPDEPVVVRCDPLRVEQALANLLSNAIKYSPDGGPIDVAVAVEPDRAVVSVSDRGIGMSEGDRRRVFEPFTRVGLSKGTIPGAGLGLYIVQKIAHAHRGSVDVDSTPGRGSTFRLCLPTRP